MMNIQTFRHRLTFKRPSGTSRGVLKVKDSWIIQATDNSQIIGTGEASLIEKLSPDDPSLVHKTLNEISSKVVPSSSISIDLPSVKFAIEMLERGIKTNQPFNLFDNSFSQGKKGIPINGLIWMGEKRFMLEQIKSKLNEGFTCIKLKIGAIKFEEEIDLLSYIRQQYSKSDISIRVDANGAFSNRGALEKLKRLSDLDIHSIEQPIRQGQWDEMAGLCELTPIPIALDEELIGIQTIEQRQQLLQTIQPQYIILKPSLLGGWKESENWIDLAKAHDIGWWVTSALESNIGLNAISQWVGSLSTTMPQGLGTGGLYTNNINSPLLIRDAHIWYDVQESWDESFFNRQL